MERDGWVERQPSSEDRRMKLVVPTEKAVAIWSELTAIARATIEKAYRGNIRKRDQYMQEDLAPNTGKTLEISQFSRDFF